MSPLNTTMATGTIAGHHTEFTPLHREANDTPVAFHVTMTVPMSSEDIVAALWVMIEGGYTLDELRHPAAPQFSAPAVVMETLLADTAAIQDALFAIPDIQPGNEDYAILSQLREFVTEQFPTPAPAAACPAPRPARRRRTLTAVGA